MSLICGRLTSWSDSQQVLYRRFWFLLEKNGHRKAADGTCRKDPQSCLQFSVQTCPASLAVWSSRRAIVSWSWSTRNCPLLPPLPLGNLAADASSPLRRRYIACLYVTCVLWSLGWKKNTKIIMSNIKFLKIVLFPYFYYFLLLIAANIMRFMLSIFFSWLFCIIVSGLSSVSHRHHFWTQKLINIGKDYRYARNLHDSVNRCTQNHSI